MCVTKRPGASGRASLVVVVVAAAAAAVAALVVVVVRGGVGLEVPWILVSSGGQFANIGAIIITYTVLGVP